MSRLYQIVLIASTILGSWLAMQAVHEFGHVLGAWSTGGHVTRVVLHPLVISRTDLDANPHPLVVAWAGPVFGASAPLLLWGLAGIARVPATYLLRIFCGFCLLANGLYIGVGSFDRIGDCGEMLRHGSEAWQLWLFGVITAPVGLWLLHGQGAHFGLGKAKGRVHKGVTYAALALCLALVVLGVVIDGN